MTRDYKAPMSSEDEALVKRLDEDYVPAVIVAKRIRVPSGPRLRRINVYIDGILTAMPEDVLNHLIDIGFLVVVMRREWK
jgi:hypothetical protein